MRNAVTQPHLRKLGTIPLTFHVHYEVRVLVPGSRKACRMHQTQGRSPSLGGSHEADSTGFVSLRQCFFGTEPEQHTLSNAFQPSRGKGAWFISHDDLPQNGSRALEVVRTGRTPDVLGFFCPTGHTGCCDSPKQPAG